MQRDLGQRTAGWFCLLTIVILTGALTQLRTAVADENHPDARPVPMPNTEDLRNWQDSQRRLPQFAQPLDPQLQESYQQSLNQGSGKYWIGVECREAPPELKSQLGLADDEGLVVVRLTSDGPAAKAGLKRHDIIVAAGDNTLKRIPDLIKAVNNADGKEISLKIIRAGKEQTIAVTPAERPKEESQFFARPGPGFMFSGGPPPELPDNVTVTIVRHGKDPAKVTVSRGDEKWDLEEKDLDKLPGELRPLVMRLVSGWNSLPLPPTIYAPPGIRFEGVPNGDFRQGPPDGPRYFAPGHVPPPRDGGEAPSSHDGNPPPRDGEHSPPPAPGPNPPRAPGFPGDFPMALPAQFPPELMERLDRLDRHLQILQDDLRRLRDDGPGSIPRRRPRDPGNGPDGGAPRDDRRDGPPPRDDHRYGPPGMRGAPPIGDHDRHAPPPGEGDGHGPPGSPPAGQPNDQ